MAGSSKPALADKPSSILRMGVLGPVFAAVLILLVALYNGQGANKDSEFFVHGQVPRVAKPSWTSAGQLRKGLLQIVNHREPVVFTETLISSWPAIERWTPEYFEENVPELFDVAKHSGRLFFYCNEDALLANSSFLHWRPPAADLDMSPKDFFTAMTSGPSKGDYYYYNGKIELLGDKLMADVPDKEGFACPLSDHGRSLNVWVSGGGMRVQTHYDSFFNYFVQVRGRKRFILFPPSEAAHLSLYPRHHPSYRQSQVPLHDADVLSRFPAAARARGLEVVLEPGELLYLPPFWFHYVEAIDEVSVSANFWCICQEFEDMESAVTSPIPVESDWPESKLHTTIAVYLRLLLGEYYVNGDRDVDAVLTRMLEQRHDSVFPATGHSATDSKSTCDPHPSPETLAALTRHVTERGHLEKLSSYFKDIDPAVREILLMNYVEELVAFAAGPVGIPSFVRKCLIRGDT